MSLISIPLFKTDNTEKLEVADAYDVANERPINKIYQASKKKAGELYFRAGGINGVTSGLTNILLSKQAGASGAQLLEQGLGMFGTSSTGLLRTVGGGVLDKAAKFIDLDPALVSKIKRTSDGLLTTVTNGNLKDISQYGNVASLMGDLSGNPEISRMINVGFESAVWGAAFTEANSFGTYDYYESVRSHVDPDVYHQAVIYSLPSVATSGSVDALKQALRALSPEVILANQPGFIEMFFSQFKLPEPHPTDMAAFSNDLVEHLTLLDPHWYIYSADTTPVVYDLKYLTKVTPDALRVLSIHPVIGPLVQIAPNFQAVSVAEVIRSQFPKMVTNLK